MNPLIIILIIAILLLLILLSIYNKLLKLRNTAKQSQSLIDVYLNQRFDLIPNLVECVKAYSKYEKDSFENILKLRNAYNESKNKEYKQATEINNELNKIMAIAENYPELKASEQYLNLQKNLVKMESQLQAARRIYNIDVTAYNTTTETVPNNIIAALFNFKQMELFQIEDYKKENINIKND